MSAPLPDDMRTGKSITIRQADTAKMGQIARSIRHFRTGLRHGCSMALICVACTLGGTGSHAATPELGGHASTRAMETLGQDIARALREREETLGDAVTLSYLEGLIGQLIGANALPVTVPSLTVFRSPAVNAFVLPGGHMGINAGLLLAAPNESALASVLAHEIAHLSQRHVERRFSRQSGVNLATLAGLIAGALVVRDNPDAAQAAIYSGLAASVQQQLDYNRAHEQEADRIGQKLLENAGFRSAGTAEMLQRMSNLSAVNFRGGIEYLQTHPLTPNRIGEAWDRAKQATGRSKPTAEDAASFSLVQARIATLLGQPRVPTPADGYARALASLERDPARSVTQLDALEEPWRSARYSRLLRARALAASGQHEDAARAFSALKADYPYDYLTVYTQAQTDAARGDYAAASRRLAQWLRTNPAPNATVLQLTAQYHRDAGLTAESQRWFGEYHLMLGDIDRAAAHLDEAMKQSVDGSNQQARLRARLEDIAAQQRSRPLPRR